MNKNDVAIKKILLDGHYITQEDIKSAEVYAKDHRGSFLDYLLIEGLISHDILGQAMAESFGIPYFDLNSNNPSRDQVLLIPEDIARKLRIVVVDRKGSKIVIATDNPSQANLQSSLESLFADKKVQINFSLSQDINDAFIHYKKGLETTFAKIISNDSRATPEVVERIIEDALSLKASDVHFEPQETQVIVRFRVDGVLHDAGKMPKEYYENIINRLKVQAKLRIDEHFSSQDGAIRFSSKNHPDKIDLRISIVPTLDGEKVVVRILSSYIEDLTLNNIGLSSALQKQILQSTQKPFGMILVTGPTGSGKTTTLYSIIRTLNTRQINITTIEDPVEYKIQGVNQIQANTQTNLTFAKGLRAIARQDPNVILVGEIRDLETADIAVNAALTGHLLLSTFHANNSATVIPRFIDMGVEPFLIASTLELIISQRLVRKICESCRVSYTMTKQEIDSLGPDVGQYFNEKSYTFYRGKGCPACSNTGFKGRIGVFEFLTSSPELQDLIGKSPSTKVVTEIIRQQGFKPMFEDGIEKVKAGITTLEELIRVVSPQ